ncbi:hypothetical protein [Streptomyces sp. JJ38]|uniref:hypothetical protein n=1 Tax=Streptomyces sp. JJ38 TaxID=2738128 RepID=UPI001C591277|nr:hypothetical protein [Streptomyces sp. JJ38]MBW1597376.1 hypothetical protein [Streptomyces sp. JJ38]
MNGEAEREPTPEPRNVRVSGGVYVGNMSGGAVAAGDGAQAVNDSPGAVVSSGEHAQNQAGQQVLTASPELLAAVHDLRRDLPMLAPEAEGVAEVGESLAELERTGQAERERLGRLRELLRSGGSAVAALAAAAPVVQAVQALLG